MKRLIVFLAVILMALTATVAFAQTQNYTPDSGLVSVITIVTMVLQWIGSFFAARTFGLTARKFIPLLNFIVSTLSQLIAAFSVGMGPGPAPSVAHATFGVEMEYAAYQYAGFFGSIGNVFVDIFVNSLLQTLVVVGGHSAQKNTREGIKLATK